MKYKKGDIMFDHYTSAQPLADQLKRRVLSVRGTAKEAGVLRQRALEAIQTFEGGPWHPAAFDQAMQTAAPNRFVLDSASGELLYVPLGSTPDASIPGLGMLEAIAAVLDAYNKLVASEPAVAPKG